MSLRWPLREEFCATDVASVLVDNYSWRTFTVQLEIPGDNSEVCHGL